MCTHTYTQCKPVGVAVVVEDIPGSKREKEGIKEGRREGRGLKGVQLHLVHTLLKDVAVLATNLLWRVWLEECVCVCVRERDMGCTNQLTCKHAFIVY